MVTTNWYLKLLLHEKYVRPSLATTQIRRISSALTRLLMLAIQWAVDSDQPPFASLQCGFSSQPVASTKSKSNRHVVRRRRRVISEVTLIGGIVVVYLGRRESIHSQSSPLRWKWEEEDRLRGL